MDKVLYAVLKWLLKTLGSKLQLSLPEAPPKEWRGRDSGLSITDEDTSKEPISDKAAVGTTFHSADDFARYLLTQDKAAWKNWEYLVLHCSATDDDPKRDNFNAIRRYHVEERKWSEIGYHLVIEKENGKCQLQLGRPFDTFGAHAKGLNTKSLGLCFVGNFDAAKPEAAMWQFGLEVTRAVQKAAGVETAKVLGHREVYKLLGKPKKKSCPGTRFSLTSFRNSL